MPPCGMRSGPSTRTGRGTTARSRRRPGVAGPDPVPVRPRGRGDGRARAPAPAAHPVSGRGGVPQRRPGRRRAQPGRRAVADRGGADRAGRPRRSPPSRPAPRTPVCSSSCCSSGTGYATPSACRTTRTTTSPSGWRPSWPTPPPPRPPDRPTTCCSGRGPSSTALLAQWPALSQAYGGTWDEHRARLERELVRLAGTGRTGLAVLAGSVAGLTGYAGRRRRPGRSADPGRLRPPAGRRLGPGSPGRPSATGRAGAAPATSTRSAACRARAADPLVGSRSRIRVPATPPCQRRGRPPGAPGCRGRRARRRRGLPAGCRRLQCRWPMLVRPELGPWPG